MIVLKLCNILIGTEAARGKHVHQRFLNLECSLGFSSQNLRRGGGNRKRSQFPKPHQLSLHYYLRPPPTNSLGMGARYKQAYLSFKQFLDWAPPIVVLNDPTFLLNRCTKKNTWSNSSSVTSLHAADLRDNHGKINGRRDSN